MHLENEDEDWPEGSEALETSVGERLEFKSVGIDIGSSTSHLMFSRLVLARRGREYFSGYTVIRREIIYRSPVILTPFLSDNTRVDAAKLTTFFQQCYEQAGLTPSEIDTGAVITTGEAAKKENTAAIINILAEDAGKFVCAAAGPNMEAVLAAHGSGAVKHSFKHTNDGHETILNVDVGGGTSKVAVVWGGQVLRTCAINVGSRLVAWNSEGILTRVEEAGARVAGSLGLTAEVGRKLGVPERETLSEKLTDLLFEVLERRPLSPLARSLMITPELGYDGPLDLVVYSGGVAEFVYGEEKGHFGDLGSWLGRSIRDRNRKWGISLGLPAERIRATVIGASQYTVQVSGNTIFLSHPELLPLRNLPVVKLPHFHHPVTRETVSNSVGQNIRLLDLEEGTEKIALGITWDHEPEYQKLRELAEGIKIALPKTLAGGLPVVLVFDSDVGKLVGHLLQECGVAHVVSIDSISLRQLSYIDIGQPLSTTNAVPVTVKSLIFR